MIKPLVRFLMKRFVSEADRKTSAVNADYIQSVAVVGFYDGGELYNQAMKYAGLLRKRGIKKVDLYLSFPNAKELETFEPRQKVIAFSKKDFTFAGKYKSEALMDAQQTNYDILVDLTEGNSLLADIVIAKTKAKWKAGRHDRERSYLLDFMIGQPKEKGLKDLVHHLDQYIMTFNTHKAA